MGYIILSLGQDLLSRLRPYEWVGPFIPAGEKSLYGANEGGYAIKATPPHGLIRQYAKPDLHHVHPGGPNGSEMEMEAPVPPEPSLHLDMFVSSIVIQYQV